MRTTRIHHTQLYPVALLQVPSVLPNNFLRCRGICLFIWGILLFLDKRICWLRCFWDAPEARLGAGGDKRRMWQECDFFPGETCLPPHLEVKRMNRGGVCIVNQWPPLARWWIHPESWPIRFSPGHKCREASAEFTQKHQTIANQNCT